MKDHIQQLLKRPPSQVAIATVQAVREFKKFHADATKKLAKKLTESELSSLYQQAMKWY